MSTRPLSAARGCANPNALLSLMPSNAVQWCANPNALLSLMPSNAVQWLWGGLGGGRTALVVVVFAAAKDLHGFGGFFMHKVSTAVMNEAAVDGLAALAAALQVTAEPPRRLFHSVGSPPN